jgi:hypothetical protein
MDLPSERTYIIIEYSDNEIEIQWAKDFESAKGMFDNLNSTASKRSARASLVRLMYEGKQAVFDSVDLPRITKKGKASWRVGEGEIDLPTESE